MNPNPMSFRCFVCLKRRRRKEEEEEEERGRAMANEMSEECM